MDKTIADCKYWLETYTESFKKHDLKMTSFHELANGRMDTMLE